MAEGLVENLGGDFSENEGVLRGNPNIVKVWVEDEFDVSFWYDLLTSFGSVYEFEITPYDNGEIQKGKSNIISHIDSLSNRFIACVDSDNDYLIDSTDEARAIISSPYILHTYVYSIENYLCHPKTLKELCIKATKFTVGYDDFELFLTKYSQTIYPILLWHLFWLETSLGEPINLDDLRECLHVGKQITTEYKLDDYLRDLKRNVLKKDNALLYLNRAYSSKLINLERKFRNKGLTPENCYLFLQGHLIYDNLEHDILTPISMRVKNQHVNYLYRLNGEFTEKEQRVQQYKNNTKNSLSVLLCCNYEYKNHCEIYKTKLKIDIERLLSVTLS